MALTKIEIAAQLVEKCGFDKRQAKQFVEQFFEEIGLCLEKGEEVKLSGFGNFTVREKKSRPGRNPKTGENVAISARKVVVFKPGQKFRDRVEQTSVKAIN